MIPTENLQNVPDTSEGVIEGIEGNNLVLRFPDGSRAYRPYEDTTNHRHHDHKENLALFLDDRELSMVGGPLKYAIEEDIESQAPFIKAVSEFITLMGLNLGSNGSQNNLPFEGASEVYSTKVFETLQALIASVRVIFKASGMVDTYTVGDQNYQLEDSSSRMSDWFNYYFDFVAKEFRPEAEQSANWTFVGGSSSKKVFISPTLDRVVSEAIPIEDFIVNDVYSSHFTAPRRTHRLRLSEKEFMTRVKMRLYRDIRVLKQDDDGIDSDDVIREATNKQTGTDPRGIPDDGVYVIYECHADLCIDGDHTVPKDGIPNPYIVSIEQQSGKVLNIFRNWEEGDPQRKRIEYFVNYKMLSALRGCGYGLVHYAAKLAAAATSLERQIINSAIFANFPGGFYQEGMRFDENNINTAPGEWKGVMSGGALKDAFFTFPYKDPSPILAELKKDLEDSIGRPCTIIDQKVSEIPVNASTQTTLAIFEELHKIPNIIMQNFYESLTVELGLFKDRFKEWLPDDQPYHFKVAGGNRYIMKSDFQDGVKVVPASDPTAKSSAHKTILAEVIMNNAKTLPDIYDMRYAAELQLKNLHVSKEDIDKLLKQPDKVPPPQPMDPVSTIMAIIKGEPVTAAVWQNHDAYLAILDSWIQNNPQNPNLQNAMALKSQYEAFKYMVNAYANLGIAPPENPSQLNPEQQNQLATEIAYTQQQAQQEQPQIEPPLDPGRVELEAAKMEAQIAHEKNELEFARIELSREKMQGERELNIKEFELKSQIQHLKAENESFKIAHDQAIKERDQALKEKDSMMEEYQHQMPQPHMIPEIPMKQGVVA